MSKKGIVWGALVAVVTLSPIAQVQAGPLNNLMRWFGWGWSDGYHAYDHGRMYDGSVPDRRVLNEPALETTRANIPSQRMATPAATSFAPGPSSVLRGGSERAVGRK